MESITYKKTTGMALAGLFAAIAAVCSWISIPLGFTPVPVNLATLAVMLAGGLLGKKYGTISLTVFTLVGAVGVPVFAGFRGGLSVLAGPTGGYIVGYIAMAFVIGLLMEQCSRPGEDAKGKVVVVITTVVSMIAGLAACYLLGTAWFIVSTGTGLGAAMVSCVIPFLPGEVLKITAATILVRKLRRFIR